MLTTTIELTAALSGLMVLVYTIWVFIPRQFRQMEEAHPVPAYLPSALKLSLGTYGLLAGAIVLLYMAV